MKKGKGLRIGVIGLGVMGQHHARIASTLPGVRLTAVADIDPPRAEETAKKFRIPPFNDYQKMLPEVDAVCLSTPTQTHFEIAQECLNAGKHLLVEKPFTGSSSLAATLLSLAKEKQRVLTVNFVERYNPAFQKLLRLLRDEKIHGIDIKRLSPYPERIQDADVVFDMMIHDLDLLRQLVADEIEDIKAKGEKIRSNVSDRVVVTIAFKSGTMARIDANRVFGVKTRKIVVTADKHLIEADLLNKLVYLRDFSSHIPSTIPVKQIDQLTEALKDFVAAIKGKSPVAVKAEDGLAALQLAERIEEACL